MLSVMGLYHTQPRQVPSTPPFRAALELHFLNLIPTEAESMVVQQAAMIANTTTVTLIEMMDAFFILGILLKIIFFREHRHSELRAVVGHQGDGRFAPFQDGGHLQHGWHVFYPPAPARRHLLCGDYLYLRSIFQRQRAV